MKERIPPQATDVERKLIGEVIQFPQVIDEVVPIVSHADFYKDAHQKIYKAVYDLWAEGKKIDLMVVTSRLKKSGELEEIGGAYEITQMISDVIHAHSVIEHAYIVKEASVKRQFIQFAGEVGNLAFDNSADIDALLDTTNSGLDTITDGIFKSGGTLTFKTIVDGTIAEYYQRKEKAAQGEFTGIRTPLYDLNKRTGGWQNGDLIIIAGRPSMGKTAFAVQCAVTASRLDYWVDIYTLEMTNKQFTQRIMGCMTDINIEHLRNGTLDDQGEQEMEQSINKLLKLRINLDDKTGITAEYVKAKSSANHRKGKCDMIIVDYLQLMAYDPKLNSNEGFGSVSRKLKNLAKELDIPVILLSQLNRSLETRGCKRPMLSDLRSSGEIEQDADIVIFPYRHYYYSGQDEDKGNIEIITAKHRNGRIGSADAYHNETITKFFDEKFPCESEQLVHRGDQLPF